MKTWLTIEANSDFSIYNLPYGSFSFRGIQKLGIAIGDQIIDISSISKENSFPFSPEEKFAFQQKDWNSFIEMGKEKHVQLRQFIQNQLTDSNSILAQQRDKYLIPQNQVKMRLPVHIGDYTDFYSSLEHATNVGKMFRPNNPLLPNWKHIPVGYHGRSSSIVVSGTKIKRPMGQTLPPNKDKPIFGPSTKMDFELEMAFVIGKNSALGQPVDVENAEEHIFGMVLFNDWSARDIQKWEYVPLGPFLGKNFASTISPWIVPLEALQPFKTNGPNQEEVLPYLQFDGKKSFDIHLEVSLTPKGGQRNIIARSNHKYLYWNIHQQLAHHTVNGCNLKVGDLLASGTISGPDKSSFGSLLELSWGGKNPIQLENGAQRTFIEDYDTINLRAWAEKEGIRIGFGDCLGTIIP